MSTFVRPRAVVTGASSGIGAALAEKLLSMGWKVCLIARRRQHMQAIADKYNRTQSKIISCDLSDEQQTLGACDGVIEWCKKDNSGLNLLVNNAGFSDFSQEIENETRDDVLKSIAGWNKQYNVMLKAPVIFTKCLLGLLRDASRSPLQYVDGAEYDGCIINVSSVCSDEFVIPHQSPYCSFKAALDMVTKLTAKELSAKYRIRCNGIKFGAFDTKIAIKGGTPAENWESLTDIHPMGKMGDMNDATQIMLFLADKKKSGFITGANINVDGGLGCLGPSGNTYRQSKL